MKKCTPAGCAPPVLFLSLKCEDGGGGPSELLVHVPGVVHQLAAGEVLAVAQNLLQLQVAVLVLVCDGDHLLGLVQSVVLVHGVHVLLRARRRREERKRNTLLFQLQNDTSMQPKI